jgi:chemotaxis protein MotB
MDLVFGSASTLPDDATAKQRVEDAGIYYAFLKRMPTTAGKNTIAEMVTILNDNPNMKLEIVGHCDDDEFNEGKINVRYKDMGKKRADQVKRLLETAGVSPDRLSVSGRENTDPASTRDSEIARAQNRRVTFLVK